MAKIPFDIKYRPQIESGEYKVKTRSGKTAKIVYWDKVENQLVVLVGKDEDVLTYNSNGTTGQQMPLPSDLFVITPEEELTPFEQEVSDIVEYCKKHGAQVALSYAKRHAKTLLNFAREELVGEMLTSVPKESALYKAGVLDGKAEALKEIKQDPESSYAFKRGVEYGKKEILKDLPRWREWGDIR